MKTTRERVRAAGALERQNPIAKIEDGYWAEAFACAMRDGVRGVLGYEGSLATFTREDVAEVFAVADGENDGAHWIGAFRLADGRFALLSAWCDDTGWGCHDGGDAQIAHTLDDLIRLAMSTDDRTRFGYPEPAPAPDSPDPPRPKQ